VGALAVLVALIALIAANIWQTLRIRKAGDDFDHKGMFIALVWIAPGVGLFMSALHLRALTLARRAAEPANAGVPQATAPDEVASGGAVFPLSAHLQAFNGVPMPDWSAVDAWAGAIGGPDHRAPAIDAVRRGWLLHLRDALGPHFWLQESPHALILSALEPAVADATARYVATARGRVQRVLGTLARYPEGERSVVIVFEDSADYYHYVSGYYPEDGEFAFSGGMFIDAGCPHFVTVRADLAQVEPVIAHELTHAALAHLRLPLWLDEGLAVNTERRVASVAPPMHTPREMHEKHQAFWGDEEIQQFWDGASFQRTDDGNLLSYDLARILVEQLSRASWDQFQQFAAHADRVDAGDGSAREHLGVDLGTVASALLDRPASTAWTPQPLPG